MTALQTKRTRLLAAVTTMALVIGTLESISWVAITYAWPRRAEPIRRTKTIFREQSDDLRRLLDPSVPTLIVFDSVLGWRHRAGYRSDLYTVNPQGLRGAAEYAPAPRRGVLRVAAFGDSFVFGSEVDDGSAWPSVVERAFPGIEVPNYGVGGYGADQAYLAYLARGSELHPRVVILGFVPDDLGRLVNVYRRFRSSPEPPLVKPRFMLASDLSLRLVANPMPRAEDYRGLLERPRDVLALGRLDYWYTPLVYENPLYDYSATMRAATALWIRVTRRYLNTNRLYIGAFMNPASEAFKIQVVLFEQAADSIRSRGAEPIIVFFPDRESAERTTRRARPSYQPLLDSLRARRLETLDVAESFSAEPAVALGRWFMPGGHYSPDGNRIVGLWLGRKLQERRVAFGSETRP